jgi:hypothetical protein
VLSHHLWLLEICDAKVSIKKKNHVILVGVPLHRVHAAATNHTREYERRARADMTLFHFCEKRYKSQHHHRQSTY